MPLANLGTCKLGTLEPIARQVQCCLFDLDEAVLQDLTPFASPRSRQTVLVVAGLLFLTAPLAVARFFDVERRLGAYPANADAIAIPIFWFVVLWLTTAPFTWWFVWLCVRRYPGRTSLAVWNHDRLAWSAGWTLAVGAAAAVFVLGTPWALARAHPSLVAHALLDLWFLLVLRSAIVGQKARLAVSGSGRQPPASPASEPKSQAGS